ncbi:Isoleucine--tRNA ligase, cytoplasmic, partial [Leucoagaricus sp. SymC.cos]
YLPAIVSASFDFAREEGKVIQFWRDIDAFQTSLKLSEGRPEYSFYDGPPFATGLPHYGHLLAGTIKDIVTRHAHVSGFHVTRRFGWDTHGLPVEHEIDKKLGITGKDDVMAMGIDKYNAECRAIVMRYSSEWRRTVERMGRWIDFDNDYKTLNLSFMESVWWAFSELFKKDLVYRGQKVMPYSTGCTTPLSNFEAGQDYRDVNDPARADMKGWRYVPLFEYFTEQFEDKAFRVVVDTYVTDADGTGIVHQAPAFGEDDHRISIAHGVLRPDEMPPCPIDDRGHFMAQVSDFVGMHVKAADGPIQKMLKAKGRLVVQSTINHSYPFYPKKAKYKKLGQFQGADMKGWRYVPLFEYFTEQVDNYTLLVYCLFIAADGPIQKMLKAKGRLVVQSTINHSYPFCWRSADDLQRQSSYTPFLTENLYQTLRKFISEDPSAGDTRSVHFLLFPEVKEEYFDEVIERQVKRMQTVIELTRNIREKNNLSLKASVPLKELLIFHPEPEYIADIKPLQRYIESELNVRDIIFTSDESLSGVRYRAVADWAVLGKKLRKDLGRVKNALSSVSSDAVKAYVNTGKINVDGIELIAGDLTVQRYLELPSSAEAQYATNTDSDVVVRLDIQIHADLQSEWLARELTNRVQKLRKKAGLQATDDVDVYYQFEDGMGAELVAAIGQHEGIIRKTVGSVPVDIKVKKTGGTKLISEEQEVAEVKFLLYLNLIVTGLVLAADGKKMSKSLKNYPDPNLIIDKYGADATRMFLVNSPIVRGDNLRFREEGVREVISRVLLPWLNSFRFFLGHFEDGMGAELVAAIGQHEGIIRKTVGSVPVDIKVKKTGGTKLISEEQEVAEVKFLLYLVRP